MQEKLKIEASDISRILGTVGSPLIVISELIKNSVDADATKIEVYYNQNDCQIHIIDDGTGITIEEIENLAKPGFSTKKIDGKLRNKHGFFFSGNKGLGILSCFSICEEVEINTYTIIDKRCNAKLSKNGVLDYEVASNNNESDIKTGTTISLKNVSLDYMDFLTTPAELQKLRHLSTYLYKKSDVSFPDITLKINDNSPTSIFLDMDLKGMLYDVYFSYDKVNEKLKFKCLTDEGKNINNNLIEVIEFDIQTLEKILLEQYGIEKIIRTRTNDLADYQSYNQLQNVPSFEGRIVVFDKQNAGATLKQYGAGVNIYVNQFALYNYLSVDNDWLGLADFSQRKKITNLRPHNVYGYVNFDHFNENVENLRISNERADFIQDQTFVKLMYLLKGVVMLMTFNIDVAERNPKYKIDTEFNKTDTGKSESSEFETSKKEVKESAYTENATNTVSPLNNNLNRVEVNTYKEKENNEHNSAKSSNKYTPVENTVNNVDEYRPDDNYKPRKKLSGGLSFTNADGVIIEKLKNKDDLSNKIYHLIYELTHLNMQNYCCSIAAIYRALLECSTRYITLKYPDKIIFQEDRLRDNITSVLNYYSNKSDMDKRVKAWREAVNKRYLIENLNQYMHTGVEVDIDFIEQTWKTMKTYIIKCLSE